MISILVIGLFAAGIPFGFLIRRHTQVLIVIERLISGVILALLFVLGISVGSNSQVINHLYRLGWQAFSLSFGAMLGSLLLALLATKITNRHTHEPRATTSLSDLSKARKEAQSTSLAHKLTRLIQHQTLWVLVSFFVGILGALLHWFPESWGSDQITSYTLFILMALVGISLGGDERALSVIRHIRLSVLLVPLMVVIGSLLGSALFSSWLPNVSLANALAIGAGFGYYSFSGIFIGHISGEEMGVIALLSNILREVTTLVAAPLMARYFGKLGPIVSGGATAMDTTLPVIVKSSGKEYAIIAIFSGIVLTILVPLLVPFLLEVF